jgi:hypothetical protein
MESLPMSRPARLLVVGCWLFWACGPSKGPAHKLEGSLSTVMDLGYDKAMIDSSTDTVAVKFLRVKDGENVVLRISASLSGASADANVPLDLAEVTPLGPQRGSVSRNVLDDPRQTFPSLERGRLLFLASIRPGERVRGEFNVTFANGTEFASGRTAFGDFDAEVP